VVLLGLVLFRPGGRDDVGSSGTGRRSAAQGVRWISPTIAAMAANGAGQGCSPAVSRLENEDQEQQEPDREHHGGDPQAADP
jgi:hypothetical protein